MNLTEHFTLEAFTSSDTALRLGIDNTLPADLMDTAVATCMMAERIRDALSQIAGHPVPILPSSGYRCLALNRAIGSDDTSDHIRAMAMDFKAPTFGTPYQIAETLAGLVDDLHIGQLIYEHTWVHTSVRLPLKQINRILTLRGKGYVCSIQKD
jgi:hypothetical protein